MQILISGDNEALSNEIRQLLFEQGRVGADVVCFSLDETLDRVVQVRPQVTILLLAPDAAKSLATLKEVRDLIHTDVLVVGPGSDPKLILRCLREGAFQYVDETEIHTELSASLARWMNEIGERQDSHGSVIAVASPCGGCGVSTLAVNVATALSTNYGRAALFDLNAFSGDLSSLLNLEPKYTVVDFCRNMRRMDRTMFQQCFAVHSTGIHLMASPRTYRDAADLTARGVRKAVSMARAEFPYVVTDLDNAHADYHAQALYQADTVLLVVRLDFSVLRQAGRLLEYVRELGIDEERIQLVAGRYRRPRELPLKEVERVLKKKIQHFVPDDPRRVIQANNKGVPVVLDRPRSRASQSLVDLAWSVNGRLSEENHSQIRD